MSWERRNTLSSAGQTQQPIVMNCLQLSHASEPNIHSSTEEVAFLVRNLIVHYRVHNRPPPPEHMPHPRTLFLKISTLILFSLLRVVFTKRLFIFQYQSFYETSVHFSVPKFLRNVCSLFSTKVFTKRLFTFQYQSFYEMPVHFSVPKFLRNAC
jgi:hypothetical protein